MLKITFAESFDSIFFVIGHFHLIVNNFSFLRALHTS